MTSSKGAPPHVEIYKGKGVQPWRIRLVAANGEPIASSEGYLTKWNAKRAARRTFGMDPIEVES